MALNLRLSKKVNLKFFYNYYYSIIRDTESSRFPLINYIYFFTFSCFLRIFLERFSDKDNGWRLIAFSPYIHYYLVFITQALSIIIIFYLITKTDIVKISKFILTLFIFVNVVPLLDLLLSSGNGFDITYMYPLEHNNIFLRLFTFFGEFSGHGVTPGQRIEIALVLLGSFIYFQLKKIKLLKNILSTVLIYLIIFSFSSTPYFIKGARNILGLSTSVVSNNNQFSIFAIKFNLLILFLLLALIIFILKKRTDAFSVKINSKKLLFYEFLFIFGILTGMNIFKYHIFKLNIINMIITSISIIYISIYTNYLSINKYKRGECLVLKSKNIYPVLFLLLGLFNLYVINFSSFALMLTYSGNHIILTNKFVSKNIMDLPLFKSFLISLNCTIIIMLGFCSVIKSLLNFPIYIYFFLCLSILLILGQMKKVFSDFLQ